jgi:hypothetical protein
MSTARTTFKDLTPLKTLAKASKSCSTQVSQCPLLIVVLLKGSIADQESIAYGKCIGKSYQEVSKGMCENEFRAFKECVQVSPHIQEMVSISGVKADEQKSFGRKW